MFGRILKTLSVTVLLAAMLCTSLCLPIQAEEPLTNLFPTLHTNFSGLVYGEDNKVAEASFRSSGYIPVESGDVLYFAAAYRPQKIHVTLQNAAKESFLSIQAKDLTLVEELGNDYAIFSFTIPEGASFACVILSSAVYNAGNQLVTLNQPFDGTAYRSEVHLTSYGDVHKSSLSGMRALFMGDSITFGALDDAPNPSWAGRFATNAGVISTNTGVGGATLALYEDQNGNKVKEWIYEQFLPYKNEEFDFIVMQGGINDSRNKLERGVVKHTDDEGALQRNVRTFAGGLQWLFYNVRKQNPDTPLFYMSTVRLDACTTGHIGRIDELYYPAAVELCEMYDIHYIDLYNNDELNEKLESWTDKYVPDTLHPNQAGHDIIYPYVYQAVLEVMAESFSANEIPPDTTATQTVAIPDKEAVKDDPDETDEESGCKSSFGSFGVIAVTCATACFFVKKKRKH